MRVPAVALAVLALTTVPARSEGPALEIGSGHVEMLSAQLQHFRGELLRVWSDLGGRLPDTEGAARKSLREASSSCEVALAYAESAILLTETVRDHPDDAAARRRLWQWSKTSRAALEPHRETIAALSLVDGEFDAETAHILTELRDLLGSLETVWTNLETAYGS